MSKGKLLKHTRHRLGLSVADMARLLGIGGTPQNAADKVRKMERGASDISGVMFALIKCIDCIETIKHHTKTKDIEAIKQAIERLNNDEYKDN